MTLIIAAKEGLYADYRKMYVAGSATLPTLSSKIHITCDGPLYALGMTGHISTDHTSTGKLGLIASVWSFYRWLSRDWRPEVRNSPLINISANLTDLFERSLIRYLHESGSTVSIVITPHHNVIVEKENAYIEDMDGFATTGSGENAAALLYNAGHSVPQIYPMVAKFDTLITAEYQFYARKNLVARFPLFLFDTQVKQTGTEFDLKITDNEYRWIMLTELINAKLFFDKKGKGTPGVRDLKKAWDYGTTVFDKVFNNDIEEVKKDLHELYSL